MVDLKLIQTETSDGFKLDGCFLEPQNYNSSHIDALLLIHGTTGNFYSGSMISILLNRYRCVNPVALFCTV